MKSLLMLFLCTFGISNAFSYTIAIYTDQPDSSKANEIVSLFKKTYPFNQFEINYEVKSVAADQLNCHPMNGIARNLGCDSENIARDAASHGVDQAVIVKNVSEYGGSGGSIPVISVNSPARTIIHEYMHALGFCDEYEYAESEAPLYCNAGGANMAMIEPNPNGYSDDADARKQHMGDIPWGQLILQKTPITHGNQLGTDSVSSMYANTNGTNEPNKIGASVGLYEGKRCNKMNPPKKNWQPGGESTIMEFVDAGLGSGNEQIVAKILDSRGVKRKEISVETTPVSVNDSNKNKEFDWANTKTDATSTTAK